MQTEAQGSSIRSMAGRSVTDPIQQVFLNAIIEFLHRNAGEYQVLPECYTSTRSIYRHTTRVHWYDDDDLRLFQPDLSMSFDVSGLPDYRVDTKTLPWNKLISLRINDDLTDRLIAVMSRCLAWRPTMYRGDRSVMSKDLVKHEEVLAEFAKWHLWTFARVLGDVTAQVGQMMCALSWLA